MTPYHAELSGLSAALLVLHWLVFQADAPPYGTAMLYCDNESALDAVFTPRRATNNLYVLLAPDKDLIQLCQTLLASFPLTIKVKHSWVKGHYKGAPKLEHLLNRKANQLATDFNAHIRKPLTSHPPLPPTFEIELFQNYGQITSQVGKLVSKTQHSSAIEDYIKRRAGWSDTMLNSLNWDAHSMAVSSFPRVTQLRIVKLAHGLYHTNYEAKKMYRATNLCPCCKLKMETLSHVFRCADTNVSSHQASAKSLLETSLLSNTPKQLTKMLLHGLEQWESMENTSTSPTPSFCETVVPTEVALIQAFQSQSSIGWDYLLRGRLSKHWEQGYTLLTPLGAIPLTIWLKTVIVHIWTYSISLWKFCNGVVHRHTIEEAKRQDTAATDQGTIGV
jgi:hypothetical protein